MGFTVSRQARPVASSRRPVPVKRIVARSNASQTSRRRIRFGSQVIPQSIYSEKIDTKKIYSQIIIDPKNPHLTFQNPADELNLVRQLFPNSFIKKSPHKNSKEPPEI